MRISKHASPGLVLAAAALLVGAVAVLDSHRPAAPLAAAGQSDFAGLVDIGGGRRLYLECRGQGGPTVVLISGYGNHGGVWSLRSAEFPQPPVMPVVAGFTRVCAYDRPGTVAAEDGVNPGRSDPVTQPSTAGQAVADLHALLQGARVPGPYVLAAHSFGGLLARLYTATYPDDVAGLVLIDATSEAFREALTPEQFSVVRAASSAPMPAYPDFERVDFDVAMDEMIRAAAARPLRRMPLAVLSATTAPGGSDASAGLPPGFGEAMDAAWRTSQAFLAGLLPNARHSIVADSGHYIQVQKPQVVVEAIRQVVAGVRDPDTWDELSPAACRRAARPAQPVRREPRAGGAGSGHHRHVTAVHAAALSVSAQRGWWIVLPASPPPSLAAGQTAINVA